MLDLYLPFCLLSRCSIFALYCCGWPSQLSVSIFAFFTWYQSVRVRTNPLQLTSLKIQANKPTNNKDGKKHGKCSSNRKVGKEELRIFVIQDAPAPPRAWILELFWWTKWSSTGADTQRLLGMEAGNKQRCKDVECGLGKPEEDFCCPHYSLEVIVKAGAQQHLIEGHVSGRLYLQNKEYLRLIGFHQCDGGRRRNDAYMSGLAQTFGSFRATICLRDKPP